MATTLAVLTSGGDSPGMNSAVRAVAKVAAGRGVRVLGVDHGYDGLIDGRYRELTRVSGEGLAPLAELDPIGCLGGTILGSVRSSRFRTPEGRAEAARRLAAADVSGLVVVGGNGSLTGAHLLAKESAIKVVGIPASIDNDIGCTAMAIGVDTALNTIIDACDRISDTARAHRRAFIVEVMGRECGYLAMASAIAAGADAVVFREQQRDDSDVVRSVEAAVRQGFARGKQRVLVIKSEGVKLGTAALVHALEERLPCVEVRATVLGHLVRGGRPSFQDRMIAGRFALAAVDALLLNSGDVMTAWMAGPGVGQATSDPAVTLVPLRTVLLETQALIDGTSETTRRRLKLMERAEGVLGL